MKALFSGLPQNLEASLFVVQHLSPKTPSNLAEILQKYGRLDVVPAEDGKIIRKSLVYVAVPDRHLILHYRKMHVVKGPKENRHRPAIDPLFRLATTEMGAMLAR